MSNSLKNTQASKTSRHVCFSRLGSQSSQLLRDDKAFLQDVARVLNQWDPPVPDDSWAQLYEYFYASHMALTRAFMLGYTTLALPESDAGERRRAALPGAAMRLWTPAEQKAEVKQFLAGFYINCALDRICSLHERLTSLSEELSLADDDDLVSVLSIDIQKLEAPLPFEWESDTLSNLTPADRYRKIHAWVHKYRFKLLLQDFNYRKHRFDRYRRKSIENFLPKGWPALEGASPGSPLLLKVGGSRASQGEYEWLKEADMTEMSPLGCLRSRCIWRLLVTAVYDLAASLTFRSNSPLQRSH